MSERIPTAIVWRAALPVAALVAVLAQGPQALTGGLALAALAVALERLAARRAGSASDRVLVSVGGLLVTLVLTGLALDAVGVGLTPRTWSIALVSLSAVGLALATAVPVRSGVDQPEGPRPSGAEVRTALRLLPWVAVVALVTVVAVHTSATSLARSDAAPLQMSFGEVSGTAVQVVVTSTDPAGPLELRTTSGGDSVSYPLITLGQDGSSTTTVSLPRSGRFVVTLTYPDQTQPLRTLVLDR